MSSNNNRFVYNIITCQVFLAKRERKRERKDEEKELENFKYLADAEIDGEISELNAEIEQ